jgi:hypothetical protein
MTADIERVNEKPKDDSSQQDKGKEIIAFITWFFEHNRRPSESVVSTQLVTDE